MDTEKVTLETPERVRLELELAGVGSRFLAAFVDSLFQALIVAGLLVGAGALGWAFQSAVRDAVTFSAVLVASSVLVIIIYYVAFEMAWGGQSPGKRMAGLVVVQDDGAPITFAVSAVRNILRLVDLLPIYYAVGIISILVTSRCKRLGDVAAGTIVVKVREFRPETAGGPASDGDVSVAMDPSRSSLIRRAQVHVAALSAQDVDTVQRFMDRRLELGAATRSAVARQIADGLRPKFPSLGRDETPDAEVFLHIVGEAIALSRSGAEPGSGRGAYADPGETHSWPETPDG